MIFINAINSFFQILVYLILARSIMSWFIRNPYGNTYKIYTTICQITEPMLVPCRKLLNRFGITGTMDFSPVLALIGLMFINNIIVKILVGFVL